MSTPPLSAPLPSASGRPSGRAQPKYSMVPSEWKLELPDMGSAGDDAFGGCRRIEEAYDRLVHLGAGTYGDVYRARDVETGEIVAVKRIKMETDNREGFPITALREIKILSKLAASEVKIEGHLLRNNIIRLREIVRSDSHESNRNRGSVYMVFDYMNHDMAGLLDRANRMKAADAAKRGVRGGHEPPFAPGQVKRYMKQLFYGLGLLQAGENNMLHRDLKNANLLVSDRGELKIADFGLARALLPNTKADDDGVKDTPQGRGNVLMTNKVITLWYRPPELLLGADFYGKEVDMWSAGCIMAEILSGKPLFPAKEEQGQVEAICRVLGRPTEANMPGCTSLKYYKDLITNHPAVRSFPPESRLAQRLADMKITDPLAVDLLEKLLTLDPRKRISAHESVGHKWFGAEPKMYTLEQMPRYQSSHEMTMKRKRDDHGGQGGHPQQQQQQPQQRPPPPQQQQQGYGGYGGGGGGRGPPPGGYGGGAPPRPPSQPSWQQERR